jgi:hypothetical protein
MTLENVITILEQTGYPVAYDHFPRAVPSIPYIAVTVTGTDNVYGDNGVYKQVMGFQIELCTEIKSPEQEKVLTDVLDANGICWQLLSEAYDADDGVYSLLYNFSEVYE